MCPRSQLRQQPSACSKASTAGRHLRDLLECRRVRWASMRSSRCAITHRRPGRGSVGSVRHRRHSANLPARRLQPVRAERLPRYPYGLSVYRMLRRGNESTITPRTTCARSAHMAVYGLQTSCTEPFGPEPRTKTGPTDAWQAVDGESGKVPRPVTVYSPSGSKAENNPPLPASTTYVVPSDATNVTVPAIGRTPFGNASLPAATSCPSKVPDAPAALTVVVGGDQGSTLTACAAFVAALMTRRFPSGASRVTSTLLG